MKKIPLIVWVVSVIISGVAVGVGETTAVVITAEDGVCGTVVVLGIVVETDKMIQTICEQFSTISDENISNILWMTVFRLRPCIFIYHTYFCTYGLFKKVRQDIIQKK